MTSNKLDPSDYVYTDIVETFSEWKNNNTDTANFKLLMDNKRPGSDSRHGVDCKASVFLPVRLEPGQSIKLPKEYDQAIRKVCPKTGQVVGGLCPWLVKVGEEDIVVHSSLDYKAAFQEQEAMELMKAMKKENELRDALKELEKRKLQVTEMASEKRSVGRPAKDK